MQLGLKGHSKGPSVPSSVPRKHTHIYQVATLYQIKIQVK